MTRDKSIAITTYIKKQETFTINYLSFYLKKIEKEEQIKPEIGLSWWHSG